MIPATVRPFQAFLSLRPRVPRRVSTILYNRGSEVERT